MPPRSHPTARMATTTAKDDGKVVLSELVYFFVPVTAHRYDWMSLFFGFAFPVAGLSQVVNHVLPCFPRHLHPEP